MSEPKNPVPELLGALGLVLLGAVVALIKAQPSDEVGWLVIFSACFSIAALTFAIYFVARRPREALDIVTDERSLRRHYRAIRRASGASLIEAIWSAKAYANIELYFARERRDLRKRKRRLRVDRVVDEDVWAADDLRHALLEFVSRTPHHQPPRLAKSPWFECYICTHGAHTKAMFIINDTGQSTPELGVYVDTERSRLVRPVAQTIRQWFIRLDKAPLPQDATGLPQATRRRWYVLVGLVRAALHHFRENLDRMTSWSPTFWRSHGFVRVAALTACLAGIGGILYSKPRATAPWIIELLVLVFIFDLGVRTHAYLTAPESTIERIWGEGTLRQRYEEMRNTPTAFLLEAIWSADYLHTGHYFEEELRRLQDAPTLEVHRLVDRRLLRNEALKGDLIRLTQEAGNLTVEATDSPEFECFLCHYHDALGNTRLKALLVFNNIRSHVPVVGLYVDPEKDPTLEAIPQTIHEWFSALDTFDLTDVRHDQPDLGEAAPLAAPERSASSLMRPEPPDANPQPNIWEFNAPSYDEYVTHTDYSFLRAFLDGEHYLLRTTISQLAAAHSRDRGVWVMEIGSGTGRELFRLAEDPELPLLGLIGIDNAHEMVRVARANRAAQGPFDIPILFFCFDATDLNDYFPDGRVDLARLRSGAGDPDEVASIPVEKTSRGPRVLCNLLNTLGVLDSVTRMRMIRAMVRSATSQDRLVFSVFAAESFPREARGLYDEISAIVGADEIPEHAFDDERSEFAYITLDGEHQYYSHWFKKGELEQIVQREGCRVLSSYEIDKYGYFLVCDRRGEGNSR